MAASRSLCGSFKTRVLHFKVKNTPLKDKNWKEKVQKPWQCSVFFLWRKESFSSRNRPSRNSTLFFSRRSAWSVLKCNDFAKFSGIFWTLWTRKLCFWWGFQYEFLNVSQTFYTFFSSALKKNPKMRLYLKWILCWILPCAQPILLTWTDPRSG